MADLVFLGWGADGEPMSEPYEGSSSDVLTLSTPDSDEAESVPALVMGTAHGRNLAMQEHLFDWGPTSFETALFEDSNGSSVTRSFNIVALIDTGSTTTNLLLQSTYQPYNGGNGLDGVPIAVVYKNSSTDSGDWTWEVRIATGQTWNSDHWEITTDAFATAPSSGDILIIGPTCWHYQPWSVFSRGSSSPLSCRAWIQSGIPDDSTSIVQVAEYPSGDNRSKGSTATVTSITAAKHAARSDIPVGNRQSTNSRLTIRGITSGQILRIRWWESTHEFSNR